MDDQDPKQIEIRKFLLRAESQCLKLKEKRFSAENIVWSQPKKLLNYSDPARANFALQPKISQQSSFSGFDFTSE